MVLAEGSLEEACTLVCQLLAKGRASQLLDLLATTMLDCCASPPHARYFASRVAMLSSSRVRRDPRALTRLALEAAAVLHSWYRQVRTQPPLAGQMWPPQQAHRTALPAASGLLTTDAYALVHRLLQGRAMVREALAALCNIKTYDLCVPVEGVSQAASKDPLWMAWRTLTDHVQWGAPEAHRYAVDLMAIYKFRFKRGQRRQRLVLLEHAWAGAFWGGPLRLVRGPVLPPVAAEVALKGCYLLDEQRELHRREAGAGRGGAAAPAQDVIGTMLL